MQFHIILTGASPVSPLEHMQVVTRKFSLSTKAGTDILDITSSVETQLHSSGLKNGVAVIFVPGSTAGVTTIEYEEGVIKDLADAIERAAPSDLPYAHNAKWMDGNGHSHVRSALIGASLSVPFVDGKLLLGNWQQIVLMDFDVRNRKREIIVQIIGE